MRRVVPDARYAAITDFDAIKSDRIGMYDLRDDRAHYAGMCNDQTVLILVACDCRMVSRADAMDEAVKRFRTLWPVMHRVIQKALVFAGAVDFDVIVTQPFPDAEADFPELRFDIDADSILFAERGGKRMTALQR